jgi:hypothetical protein
VKRFLGVIAVLVLVTGCGNGANTANNAAVNNTTTNTTNTQANQTAVGNTQDNPPSTGNVLGGNSAQNPAENTQELSTYAKGIMDYYVRSHNAKTLAEYQVMANQMFIPGLASIVGSMAQSGVDYNHPIATYTIHVDGVQTVNTMSFIAKVTVRGKYKDGTKLDRQYHVKFVQGGQLDYMIQSIS